MIITLKNQLCLLAFRACFIQKKFFVENVDSQQISASFLAKKKSGLLPESAIFWDFRPAAVQTAKPN